MVLLTTTTPMVEGLRITQASDSAERVVSVHDGEADLSEPAVGKPISHGQVLQLWQALRAHSRTQESFGSFSLEALLVGARVYVPPPAPKPEPTVEYKELMASLRRDEEARAYERMVRPPDVYATAAYAQVHRPTRASDLGDGEDAVTMSDVNRQVMLILNFVLTMAGVAYALWVLARWWPTPPRLFLAMGGSVLMGLAEYGLYAGYVWHLTQAAKKDKATATMPAHKQVLQTWVVNPGDDAKQTTETTETDGKNSAAVLIPEAVAKDAIENANIRRRRKQEPPPAS